MKRCVIVGGAKIGNYEKIKEYFKEDDFFIYCDCGLDHSPYLGTSPNLIVGDFDSYEFMSKPINNRKVFFAKYFPDSEVITLPREKDDTDTVFAAKEALRRGFKDFLIIGALGGRFDHSIGNIGLLLMLHESAAKALLVDDFSEMQVVGNTPSSKCTPDKSSNAADVRSEPLITSKLDTETAMASISDNYSYFSLLSVFGDASGVSISGAKFPTDSATFTSSYQYGVSNEVLANEVAQVRIESGAMLLVKVF